MEIFFIAVAMLVAVALPLAIIYFRAKHGKKSKTPLITNLCCFFGLLVIGCVFCFSQSAEAAEAATTTASAASDGLAKGLGYIGAALAVGLSGIGGGIAVGASSSAALGAISENDSIFGKSLIFVGLAEGIALYGLLIAFMIISSL
ncbi:MAG: ATPase [Firmicutes bacterium HGW-Firmicutes-16]|nr:MAG: ATPase [Firmicutes bacterium HGW-Firmicutes-16]